MHAGVFSRCEQETSVFRLVQIRQEAEAAFHAPDTPNNTWGTGTSLIPPSRQVRHGLRI